MAAIYLKKSTLYKMLFRVFFIQGSWNYRALIGMGFCFCAVPIVQRLYQDSKEKEEFLRRHLAFFNAHPYFASWCLGAVARLEEEALKKDWDDHKPIEKFKERLTGPLGAIGDRMFWRFIKPLTAGIGVLLALLIGWGAVPIFLVLYNIPHLYIRIKGLFLSYRKGFDIISDITERKFKSWFKVLPMAGAFVAGMCTIVAAHKTLGDGKQFFVSFSASLLITLIFSYFEKSMNIVLLYVMVLSIIISISFQL